MKKVIVISMAICCMMALSSFGQVCGDANGDGAVDIVDALLVAKCYIGGGTCPSATVADVNCSGTVDIIDALKIAQYSVGLVSALNCCATPAAVHVGVSAGIQCETPIYPTLESAVSLLTSKGIPVLASYSVYNIVITLCGTEDGRFWIAQINGNDLQKAIALGFRQVQLPQPQ
jgi:hypothetical protein